MLCLLFSSLSFMEELLLDLFLDEGPAGITIHPEGFLDVLKEGFERGVKEAITGSSI